MRTNKLQLLLAIIISYAILIVVMTKRVCCEVTYNDVL